MKKFLKKAIKITGRVLLILALVFGNLIVFPRMVQAAPIAQYTGGLLVYGDTATAGRVRYRVFDNTTGFGVEQNASSVGTAIIEWIRVVASPTADEWIIVTRDTFDITKAQVCTGIDGGVSCGTATQIAATAGTHSLRNVDVAYEQLSGDALLVYGVASTNLLRKIEWTGGAWVNDASITNNRTLGEVEWVELTARPGSNQIGIAYSDSNNHVSAYRWSGTAVGDEATAVITDSASTADLRKFDVSFEGTSGDMLVAAPLAAAGTTALGQLVDTTWTISDSIAPDNVTGYIDLQEPNPSDDDIAMVAHGSTAADANTMEGYEWSGTAMVDGTIAVDTSSTNWAGNYHMAATAYLSTTYYAVAVFSDITGADDINWWTMTDAGVWTVQADNLRTRGTIRFIKLFDFPNLDKVLLLSADANSDLWADTWDGSAPSDTVWSDLTSGGALETALSLSFTDVVDFAFRLSASVVVPTVTTNAETGVGVSSATLNGTVSNDGGDPADTVGFAYGTDSTLATVIATTTESGTFATSATFDEFIQTLKAGTTYYFRAYATNQTGTGYGSIDNFTTGIDNTPSRKMRLFEGYRIKNLDGRIRINQQ